MESGTNRKRKPWLGGFIRIFVMRSPARGKAPPGDDSPFLLSLNVHIARGMVFGIGLIAGVSNWRPY
jgi:hypothetical protein